NCHLHNEPSARNALAQPIDNVTACFQKPTSSANEEVLDAPRNALEECSDIREESLNLTRDLAQPCHEYSELLNGALLQSINKLLTLSVHLTEPVRNTCDEIAYVSNRLQKTIKHINDTCHCVNYQLEGTNQNIKTLAIKQVTNSIGKIYK